MQEHDISKMKWCKFFMGITEPQTLIFPTIWGKKNNIKVTEIIKDQTGTIIKVILPGNVEYDVIQADADPTEFKDSGNRKIYITEIGKDKLKKNVLIFKDLKDEIYEPDKIFKIFEKDYKDNMMRYYGYSNIYYLFLQPLIINICIILLMTLRSAMTPPLNLSKDIMTVLITPQGYSALIISFVVLMFKLIIVIGPIKHITGIIGHLDLITDNRVQSQAILLLFEILGYFWNGAPFLISALTNNVEYGRIDMYFGITLLFITCALTILVGETIQCELEGKSNCKPTFFTELERNKTCNELEKKNNEEFMNFSNNHNNNLSYTIIKEQFTAGNKTNENCNKRVLPWDVSFWINFASMMNSQVKVVAGIGKLKDYINIKNFAFWIIVLCIIIIAITQGIDATVSKS